ncbi:hypothetical protein AAFF_G00217990 [Aldrovandia affinis]|uniref:Uncharacterized protein n=1 Tax=Aldrovandia affinis TaxID=143900 RepID=A0AAD7WUS1_9TELE|nr:hypothetical protein AAFF_G00217990 [Aldrovandia affinis]
MLHWPIFPAESQGDRPYELPPYPYPHVSHLSTSLQSHGPPRLLYSGDEANRQTAGSSWQSFSPPDKATTEPLKEACHFSHLPLAESYDVHQSTLLSGG